MDMSVVAGSVVVGVDGSRPSATALEWAVRQAAKLSRPLTVVHACGHLGAMPDFEDLVTSERGLKSVGRTIAREAAEDARMMDPTIGVDSVVTMGSPEVALLEAAESASLLVVGARGRGAISSMLLGSVSHAVARQAHCPVVVVPSRPSDTAETGPVVVGVDGTPASTAAVEFAFQQASIDGVGLTVLHATWDMTTRAAPFIDVRSFAEKVNLSEEEELLVAETLAGLTEKYPEVILTEEYKRGDPVRALVKASATASLVVVGSRGRRPLTSTLLGSVSRAVTESSECPVAVVHP